MFSSNLVGVQKWSSESILNDKIGKITAGIVDTKGLDESTWGVFFLGIVTIGVSVLGIASLVSDKRLLSLIHWIVAVCLANLSLIYIIFIIIDVEPIKASFKVNLNASVVRFLELL